MAEAPATNGSNSADMSIGAALPLLATAPAAAAKQPRIIRLPEPVVTPAPTGGAASQFVKKLPGRAGKAAITYLLADALLGDHPIGYEHAKEGRNMFDTFRNQSDAVLWEGTKGFVAGVGHIAAGALKFTGRMTHYAEAAIFPDWMRKPLDGSPIPNRPEDDVLFKWGVALDGVLPKAETKIAKVMSVGGLITGFYISKGAGLADVGEFATSTSIGFWDRCGSPAFNEGDTSKCGVFTDNKDEPKKPEPDPKKFGPALAPAPGS